MKYCGAVPDPATSPRPRRRPSGRRSGDSGTREAILDASRELFADHGYEGASLRAIAARAGVDPALIRHFFGNKRSLFARVSADRVVLPARFAAAFAGPVDSLGERVVTAYLDLWEDEDTGAVLRALLKTAVAADDSAEMLGEILGAQLRAAPGVQTFTVHQRQNVILAATHLLGVAIARYVARIPPLASMPRADLVSRVAPTIQRYLTEARVHDDAAADTIGDGSAS